MAEDDSGAGGGGAPLGIYDYDELRAAILADSPKDLNALVLTWERMAGVLQNVGSDLSPIINAIGSAVATQHVGPALVSRLVGLGSRIHNLSVDLHTNASALNQADLALRAAQKEIARLDGDGTRKLVDLRTGKDQRAPEAARTAYALNDAYADAITLMVVPGDDRHGIGTPGVPSGKTTPSPAVTGPGSAAATAGIAPPVRPRVVDNNSSPGQQPTTSPPDARGRQPGLGRDVKSAGDATGRRIAVPGARGGGPIGGSRIPVTRGGLMETPTETPRSAVNAGGVGAEGSPTSPSGTRPGSLQPGGGTPGRGGGDEGRRRRRLSWYERIEDEFVDGRSANSVGGVIPRAPERPVAVDPVSALIGGSRVEPEVACDEWQVPTVEAPPQGFPDTLESGTFSQPDGTRFQVRRRGSSA